MRPFLWRGGAAFAPYGNGQGQGLGEELASGSLGLKRRVGESFANIATISSTFERSFVCPATGEVVGVQMSTRWGGGAWL